MNAIYTSRYTAFAGDRLLACGAYADIAQALASLDEQEQPVLVFDDATGAPVDAPPRPEHAALLARMGVDGAGASDPANSRAAPRPSPGRPRLGVVAREVTLLPRHWDWLSAQPGGASAALRRLVDQARKLNEKADSRRQSSERSYRFMSAIAGDQPQFEEAARALFAGDAVRFAGHVADWPPDVREYLMQLAEAAFLADDAQGSPE